MIKTLRSWTLIVVFLLATTPGWADHTQLVAGAGPSTKVVELFFAEFSKDPACKDYSFVIMPTSIKHQGGILSSNKYLFGRTGRPLTDDEKASGKAEILLGMVPISFAVGLETGVKEITLKQLEQIFTGEISNWKQLGGNDAKIVLIGREQSEALFLTLKKKYPFFKDVKFDSVLKKDDEVIKLLQSPAGAYSIGFGAKPNFTEYNLLSVNGFSSGVALGLVYDLKNSDHSIIKAASKYAASPAWEKQLPAIDMLPVD